VKCVFLLPVAAAAAAVTSGNPVSSFVCFNLVVVPALRKMSGWAQPQLRRVQVSSAETQSSNSSI
jgi:molybdopterin biosynthesis enzyme